MIKLTLGVDSFTWSPDEIGRALGREPDRRRTKGEPFPYPPFTRKHRSSGWYLDVPVEVEYPGDGESGISASIVALGEELAQKLSALPQDECTVSLSIVQKVFGENDSLALGIHLRVDAMQWLVTAHADIDLDQYFYDTPAGEREE